VAAQWPLVRARLLSLLPTLPGWDAVEVWGGVAYDAQKALICTVGHATDGVTSTAGNWTSTLHGDGFQHVETGSVVSQLSLFDSTVTLEDNLTTLIALIDVLDEEIRADRRLGVLSQEGYFDLTCDVASAQAAPGALVSVTFTTSYTTVT
jgi:hypothetical protein